MTSLPIRARARARARKFLGTACALIACGSAACSAAEGGDRGSVSTPHGSREYVLHVPTGYDGKQPLPLLVALHGCLQTPEQLVGLARLAKLADEERLLVLSPQQSASANPARCWNWFNPADQVRDSGEPAIIKAMIDEVRAKHAVDGQRIYAVGLSAGGLMSGILLACYPDVFAAGVIASAGMYKAGVNLNEGMAVLKNGSPHDPHTRGKEAWECGGSRVGRPVPVLVIDGDADQVVAAVNSRQILEQVTQLNDYADDGKDNDTVRSPPASGARERSSAGLDYTCRDAKRGDVAIVRHCTVHGLGHAWSGGDAAFPYAEPKGPDATALAWEFLEQHPRAR
jgi:poly(hydroxyalkanoate) depolymerase family esterase